MSFISLEYILFFCIVVPVYFAIPLRWRWVLLLIAGYFFYAFTQASYVLLIVFTTLTDYLVAVFITNMPVEQIRKRSVLLCFSIVVNLGVLFTFKYFNFFSENISAVLMNIGINNTFRPHHLILPIGISFYTFQSMAYTIDVYRGKLHAERNLLVFAAFVAFFPQLVAGPIERAPHLLPQFREKFSFDYERVVSGLQLVLWGTFKKVVIADTLALYVNTIYNDVENYSGLPLIVATFFFAFQIYCDFSGYSDIAIGSARIMGFDLMENFRQPYFSRSVREFWRRWHISLSTWFRDYLYIPLGGNRVSFQRNLINLLIVFIVSGLWHGAKWTFVIWGALHGGYIVIELLYSRWQQHFHLKETFLIRWLQRCLTFLLILFAWIFFRANTIADANYILGHLFDFSEGRAKMLRPLFNLAFDPRLIFICLFGLIAVLMFIEWGNQYLGLRNRLMRVSIIRWGLYYTTQLLILVALLLVPPGQPFIYFQF